MLKIMIVDDEIMSVKTLTVMIEKYIDVPHLIRGETDFENALELIDSFKPDLLLLDVVMPPRTGFDLLAADQSQEFQYYFYNRF
jgi:YesN/AraC family two-component response regulator